MAKLGKIATKRRGKAHKVVAIDELQSLFTGGQGIVLMDNKGLSVEESSNFRRQLRGKNVAVKIAKNTLIGIALKNAGYDIDAVDETAKAAIKDKLVGPTIVAVGLEDPVSPAKGIMEFLKDNEDKVEIKGGLLEGRLINKESVLELSKLPGREEMISMLLGSLNAPAQNLCYAMNACVSQFAWALAAHQRKLEEEASAA